MLVEFFSVISNYEEQYEKGIQQDLIGEGTVSIYNSKDELCPTIVDMALVTGWEVNYTYYNKERKSCIIALMKSGEYSRPLLVEPEDFKKIISLVRGENIYTLESLLNNSKI